MKTPTLSLALLATALLLTACASPALDSVSRAKDVNEEFAPKISDKASNFLIAMVDARLMDFQEGKLAAERGTQPAIREYGEWMVRDQTTLLQQLESLSIKSEMMVPSTVGAAKLEGLKDLQAASGKEFDELFMRMIRIDHERDVEAFKKATQFDEPAVREFALRTLPVIETHLVGIRQVQKAY